MGRKYTQNELRQACQRMTQFRDAAARNGRSEDAETLETAAAVLGAVADSYGMKSSPIKSVENEADAAIVRTSLAHQMIPVNEPIRDQACCPYSNPFDCGVAICTVCGVFKGPFTIMGSQTHYICLTQFVTRPGR